MVLATATIWFPTQGQLFNNVYANSGQSQLTWETNSGREILTVIESQKNPEVSYRVIWQDAPIGKKLSLSCN